MLVPTVLEAAYTYGGVVNRFYTHSFEALWYVCTLCKHKLPVAAFHRGRLVNMLVPL